MSPYNNTHPSHKTEFSSEDGEKCVNCGSTYGALRSRCPVTGIPKTIHSTHSIRNSPVSGAPFCTTCGRYGDPLMLVCPSMSQVENIPTEDIQLANACRSLGQLADLLHKFNKKWWVDIHTGEDLQRNVGELLMLAVSELSEAMEGHRKNLMDDKLPNRKMFEVELADAIIRILDTAAGMGLDIGGAVLEKTHYNLTRVDHTHAARLAPGGKSY